jgi:2-deoxy-D-gluconate 3-dehydrogenase
MMTIYDMFNLQGKTALVTGCSRGIGLPLAIGLAKAGANIIGVSRHLDIQDSEVGKSVTATGRAFQGYNCDFLQRSNLYDFIEKLRKVGPPPDILINNAGTILRKPAAEHPDAYWDEVLEVNLTAQFILAREIGKEMINRGSGKIVFTASLLSFQGGILVPGYAASKAGVAQLTKALANEWAGKGVNVNAIAPGYIATQNTKALREDKIRNQQILERIPAGRWGTPEDLVGAVIFLCSNASAYVHGTTLVVDGGWLSR